MQACRPSFVSQRRTSTSRALESLSKHSQSLPEVSLEEFILEHVAHKSDSLGGSVHWPQIRNYGKLHTTIALSDREQLDCLAFEMDRQTVSSSRQN